MSSLSGAPDPASWTAAEAALAPPLARLAHLFGALDARQGAAPGLARRLAIEEAAALSWHLEARLPRDRLCLHLAGHGPMSGGDAPALARTAWAVGRLGAETGPDPADPARFLGRPGSAATAGWAAGMGRLRALHPITRAGVGWALWPGPALDGAVLAGRMAAAEARDGARFLPLALAGGRALATGGPPADRLEAWIAGAGRAVRAALALAARLAAWQVRAGRAVAGLSGRTPGRLVAALAAMPLLSAEAAARDSGASPAGARRNLARLEAGGLVRELTGQARFRLWEAAL